MTKYFRRYVLPDVQYDSTSVSDEIQSKRCMVFFSKKFIHQIYSKISNLFLYELIYNFLHFVHQLHINTSIHTSSVQTPSLKQVVWKYCHLNKYFPNNRLSNKWFRNIIDGKTSCQIPSLEQVVSNQCLSKK